MCPSHSHMWQCRNECCPHSHDSVEVNVVITVAVADQEVKNKGYYFVDYNVEVITIIYVDR